MRFVTLLFLLLPGTATLAQIQTARYELETRRTRHETLVIPAGSTGLLVLDELRADRKTGQGRIQMVLLDQSLNQVAKNKIFVPRNAGLRLYASNRTHLYLIFSFEIHAPAEKYFIVAIDLLNNSVSLNNVTTETPLDLVQAEVVNESLILAGETNGTPGLFQYCSGEIKFRSIEISPYKGEMLALRMNDDEESYNLITAESEMGKPILYVRTYYDQEPVFDKKISMDAEVLDALSVGFIDGDIVVAGTYGSRSKNYVEGIFYTVVSSSDNEPNVEYHDFSRFDQFFAYETNRYAEKMKSKAQNRAEKGRNLKFDKFLFIRDLAKNQDEIVITFDVYRKDLWRESPQRGSHILWNAHNLSLFNYFWRMSRDRTSRYGDVFESGEDIPALSILQHWVVSFKMNGQVSWDNAMPVLEQDRLSGDRIINSGISQDALNIVYYHNSSYVFSEIPFSSSPQPELLISLKLMDDNEKVREGNGFVGSWYGSNMYIWGYQRIKGSNGKRDVIYINKLEFP